MVKITMSGEGETITEALYDLSLNVEAAIKRAKEASSDDRGAANKTDGEPERDR